MLPERDRAILVSFGSVNVYDTTTGEVKESYRGTPFVSREVTVDATGQTLTAMGDGSRLLVWRRGEQSPIRDFPAPSRWGPEITPDGSRVLISSAGGEIFMTDIETGIDVWTRSDLSRSSRTPFAPDSSSALLDTPTALVCVSLSNGQDRWRADVRFDASTYSIDGTRVYGARGKEIVEFDAASGAVLRRAPLDRGFVNSMRPDPDGGSLLVSGAASVFRVRLSDLSTFDLKFRPIGYAGRIYPRPGRQELLAVFDSNSFIIDATSGKVLKRVQGIPDLPGSAAFDPSGAVVVLPRSTGFSVARLESGSGLETDPPTEVESPTSAGRRGVRLAFRSLVASNAGPEFYTLSTRGVFQAWSFSTGALLRSVTMTQSRVETSSISRDGRLVSWRTSNPVGIVVGETATGRVVATVPLGGSGGEFMEFSPDGRWLAFREATGLLRLLDTSTWQVLPQVGPQVRWLLQWSEDSTRIGVPEGVGGSVLNVPSLQREFEFPSEPESTILSIKPLENGEAILGFSDGRLVRVRRD